MVLNTTKQIKSVTYNGTEIPLATGGITKKNITIDMTKLVVGSTNFPSDFFDNYFIDIQCTDGSGQSTEVSLDENYLTAPQTIYISNDFINILTDCPYITYTESIGNNITYNLRYEPIQSNNEFSLYSGALPLTGNNLYLLYNSTLKTPVAAKIMRNTTKYKITYVSIQDGISYTVEGSNEIFDVIKNSIVRIETSTGKIGTITGGNILSSTDTVAYVLVTEDILDITN